MASAGLLAAVQLPMHGVSAPGDGFEQQYRMHSGAASAMDGSQRQTEGQHAQQQAAEARYYGMDGVSAAFAGGYNPEALQAPELGASAVRFAVCND